MRRWAETGRHHALAAFVLLTLTATVAACTSSPDGSALPPQGEVTGIVVDLDGSLTEVRRFSVRTDAGEVLEFIPAPDATFDGGPIAHLRDHLVSAEPVRVRYERRDGRLIAIAVEDA